MSDDVKKVRLKRYTDKAIIAALRDSGGLVEIAARQLGCAPLTIYRRIEKSEKVSSAIASEREYSIDLAERNLRRGLASGEQWATVHALRYLGAKRGYIEKQQIEHSGSTEIILKWDENASSDDSPAEDAPEAGEYLPAPGEV